jgi:hypothetical protein
VSIGDQHDKTLVVWNIANGTKLSTVKLVSPVLDIAFSPIEQYFVICGKGFLRKHGYGAAVEPQPVELAEMSRKQFVSVAIHSAGIFALTADGNLCSFA